MGSSRDLLTSSVIFLHIFSSIMFYLRCQTPVFATDTVCFIHLLQYDIGARGSVVKFIHYQRLMKT